MKANVPLDAGGCLVLTIRSVDIATLVELAEAMKMRQGFQQQQPEPTPTRAVDDLEKGVPGWLA